MLFLFLQTPGTNQYMVTVDGFNGIQKDGWLFQLAIVKFNTQIPLETELSLWQYNTHFV